MSAPAQDWNALSDDDFRKVVRTFFTTHYPEHLRYSPSRRRLSDMRGWYDTLSQHGWVAPSWPTRYGGMGLEPGKLVVFIEEQEAYGVARVPDHGIIMVGPLLIQQGTDEQRLRYLPKILTGEEIWCQGYSEPNAGSDLASLRTEAVLDGDHFVVNGQKTWSTLAQDGTHMFMLVRTDKMARKQEGISFLLVDMTTPGITVRPMRTLSGHEEFCEVFFDDVRVPKENIVGEINKGWGVAKALLSFERLFLGSPKLAQSALSRLSTLAVLSGRVRDPVFRDKFTALQLDVDDLNGLYRRFTAQVSDGEKLGPDVSILKIWGTETFSRIGDLIVEVSAGAGMIDGPSDFEGGSFDTLSTFYNARPSTIYGGTNEVQRNIVAGNVLNLPST
ncbi:acyl-CoA dehydrogenase family protein [Oryzicola mucosus]|uniref:Acyl-CoA dehydrogenase family protein n=1 Tax=Oryzicola mucosus TaxID=2767425 RepID=A0A8J6TZV6_9HYPH|nr:acyl-CoA dehydrogenase family protein [Oryzicola mucosus]MBD0416724.1 acyl-CoA dehydrogenase family protein [Oryzicola mucosus]